MRAILMTTLVVSACTPDIVSGAYLCGPESSCPDGQVCNGTDNLCVLPGSAQPFSCGDKITEAEPNNAPGAAQNLESLQCVSTLVEIKGCTPADDHDDYYAFDVPAQCNATVAKVRLSFPLAFEQLTVDLGGTTGTAEVCTNTVPDDANETLCISQPVTPGMHYTLHVARSGVGDCGGACGYNRYTLGLQLGTP
jgi:hypothetical protein